MCRGDGCLNLIRTRLPVPHCLVDQREALGDELGVPSPAILIIQQHDLTGRIEASRRACCSSISAVRPMISGSVGTAVAAGAPLCDEAIRLARLLLRLFQTEPEIMGLTALMLLQHARTAARFDAAGEIVLLDDQDRGRWDTKLIAEGLALIDKAVRHGQPGPYQIQAAIAATHARAREPEQTDWAQIAALYAALERIAAVAGGDAEPRGRGEQGARTRGCTGDDRTAG